MSFSTPLQQPLSAERLFDWTRLIPFAFLHLGMLGVFWCGWSPTAVWLAVMLYFIRMFAITAFYHRYFSHRAFQTSRFFQCVFAIWAMLSVQRGPLWWASHHRLHHRVSDTPDDPYSPVQHGFWWSHIGWMTALENMTTDYKRVADLAKFPELVFLDQYDWIVPAALFLVLYGIGSLLAHFKPELHTNGFQWVIWGFFISTVVVFHATCTINSLSHRFGSRRYETADASRNNVWLALLTLGEGWHNNHHQYPACVRQGFFWWEIDITYYALKVLAWFGVIQHLKQVPQSAYKKRLELIP